ncbi:MAG TPA: POTRA domain-containing protein [Terriglobales bacterium]|nr:POTRA domain-containing protein [Terriglobales bacterium]
MLQRKTAWVVALLLCLSPGLALAQNVVPPTPKAAQERPAQGKEDSVPTSEARKLSIAAGVAGPLNGYQGSIVRDIQFRGFSSNERVTKHLHELVSQQTGQPLDRNSLRRSIQSLYATGRFANIEVQAEPLGHKEMRLVFVGRENYFIGGVTVQGNPKRPTAAQLVNASKLQLGELFTPEKLERAVANMRSVLVDNGYYRPEIRHTQQYRPDIEQVLVQFDIVPNEPAKIGKIIVQGNPGYSVGQVEDIAHMHPGDTVSSQRVTRALQRLRNKYQKQKRLEAQVSIVDRTYHPDTNRLDYVFRIDRGPTVDVQVEGADIRKGLLKRYVPIYEEGAVDDDLLNEGRRNLRDHLQTKGYFYAEVDFERDYDESANKLNVVYKVDRGDSQDLVAVMVNGNKYFDDATIRERMGVRAATGFFTHGVFSQSQLARDIESIENLYRANGFLDVKVKGEVIGKYRGDERDIAVAITVDEGEQTRVNSLKIIGNKTVPEEQIRNLLTTIEGQPFSDFNVATDRDSIVNYYFNHGFPDIQFESASKPVEGKPKLRDVVFTLKEGEQVFVNSVLVSGLNYTRPFVVQRELQVHEGDPLSQMGMLESQRRLYDLGIFNEVDMAVQNPDGAAKYKDILFQVREAQRWTFNYGFGFEVQTGSQPLNADLINTAPAPGVHVPPNTTPPQGGTINTADPDGGTGVSPRVSFEVTRLNFRGRNHTLLFKSHVGRLSRRALVSYDAPRWFDKENLRMTFTIFADNSRDVRTFTSERLEGSAQAEQVLSRVTTLLYRFQYRRVKVDPRTLVISPEQIPILSRPVRVGMPSFTYIRDKRDDPIDTHKGNYTTFDTGIAAGAFGSAANFGRFLIQNSTYVPIKKRFVLARSTRIGVEEPFGKGNKAIIPLPERFFAGGSQSHRGFALNQAGPRDLFTGFPLGGNAIFVNQVELRMPPVALPWVGENLNFVLFHDSGNVFESGQDMAKSLFRWYQPRREACSSEVTRLSCSFNYMSHAVGLGARYKTPMGPIRVDFSYNLNPSAFPFYVQCPSTPPTGNNPGPCATLPASSLLFQSGTLRHFNFFFSIGQTF